MNKNESKYYNTAIRMDEALIALLEKKDFDYITIKEICSIAKVNRSTFYLHYENTSDLLKETAQYILDKHFAYYSSDSKNITERVESCDPKDLVFITTEYLTPYMLFIKENQRVFKISIKHFNALNMDEVYEKMFEPIFKHILKRFHVPENEQKYVISFYLTGVFAIITEWLAGDCLDDMNTVIRIITDCVLGDRNVM